MPMIKKRHHQIGTLKINYCNWFHNTSIFFSGTDTSAIPPVNVGDKLKVYYGPTHESKVTYEAKVVEIENSDPINPMYMVHYTGWNTRYDEWIKPIRIAENLSATTKAKKLRQNSSAKVLKKKFIQFKNAITLYFF